MEESLKNTILNVDCKEGMNTIPPESIDVIFTDPPYISSEYGTAYSVLAAGAHRVLKPGGFLITYAAQYHLLDVMNLLGEHLEYFWICSQLNSGAKTLIFSKNVMAGFKPILIYQKPPFRKPVHGFLDVMSGKRMKAYHQWEQSIHETLHLLSRFADPGDIVLDPFAGSGTNVLAAKLLGLDWIGMEIDPGVCSIARARMTQTNLDLFCYEGVKA